MGDRHPLDVCPALDRQGLARLVLPGQEQRLETKIAHRRSTKKSPACAGLFVSESASLRVVGLRRLNQETLLSRQVVINHCRNPAASSLRLSLLILSPLAVAIPSSLPAIARDLLICRLRQRLLVEKASGVPR